MSNNNQEVIKTQARKIIFSLIEGGAEGEWWGEQLFRLETEQGLPIDIMVEEMKKKKILIKIIKSGYIHYTLLLDNHKIRSGRAFSDKEKMEKTSKLIKFLENLK
jgi:hypothetical protein